MKHRILLTVVFVVAVVFLSKSHWQNRKPIEHERFVKLDANGAQIKSWQGPWSCVYDKDKGLLWEAKKDDESIHDGYWTYSWFENGLGQENKGDCYFEANRCDTQDLIRRTNQQELCGVKGWRLPKISELKSLVKTQDRPGRPLLATDFFSQIKNGDYWSKDSGVPLSGAYQNLVEGANAFNFHQAQTLNLPYRNAAFVMLVTEQLPNWRKTNAASAAKL